MKRLQTKGTILLVESSEDDVYLLGKALQRAGFDHYLQVARTGEEALQYLGERRRAGKDEEIEWPNIVLLRGWLRDMEGMEVLRWIRSDTRSRHLRVYLMGATVMELEIARTSKAAAEGYWLKPVNAGEYSMLAERIKERLAEG